ncbi:hypothetical protein KAR91_67270 [Candidatus Pacearchaeota archaeon]|nr:hypothetical protein [Candidatus Pacearchaeota archaeon]
MGFSHRPKGGPKEIKSGEELPFRFDTTPVGGSPTSITIKVFNDADDSDVEPAVMPVNSPTADGDDIVCSVLKTTTAGITYRIEAWFTSNGALQILPGWVEAI